MISFNNYIDFGEFDEFDLISENKSAKVFISSKKSRPSKNYIFKIFQFECFSSRDQKIILETFYHISRKKCQYLLSYSHLSFSYDSKFNPTFSMKYISSKTLAHVLTSREFISKLSIKDIMQCLFAVAEGMSFLHNNLIYHGNLCPSNIIIDDANQFYLCDFGLYPIKEMYVKDDDMFNSDYKDPYMKNNKPTFINDIYSFGVLMCDVCIMYLKVTNKMKLNETLHNFLKNSSKNKFDLFPLIFAKMIPSCLNSFVSERPTFGQIIEIFKNSENQKIADISIQDMFDDFINSSYIFNLASKNDSISLNKIGKMYEKGKKLEKSVQKAIEYYEKASKLNNSDAQNNYGVLLQRNAGKNEFDIIKGAHYLQLSAEQGNVYGMANYGTALLNGVGVDKNYQKAEEYLQKSADLGYSFAQLKYGCLLLCNNPSISVISEGLNYIKKAINQQNSEAYYTFGLMLQKGNFVEKDDDLAMDYIKIAADLGNEKAILEYAGRIVEKDPKIAYKYYQIAFENGNKNVKKKMNALKEKLEEPKTTTKQINKTNKTSVNKKLLSDDNDDSNEYEKSEEDEYSEEQSKVISKNRKSNSKKKTKINSDDDDDDNDFKLSKKTLNRCLIMKRQLSRKVPAKVTTKMKLISLGNIVHDRESYHTCNYIYPVGYVCEREYFSIANPEKFATYRSSIVDGGTLPIFRVECLDASKKMYEGNTPSKPWREVLSEIRNAKNKNKNKRNSEISGPCAFGLSNVNIKYLIEQLPNAHLCKKYRSFIHHSSRQAKKKSRAKRKDSDSYEDSNSDEDEYNGYENNDKNDEDESDSKNDEDYNDDKNDEDESDDKDDENEDSSSSDDSLLDDNSILNLLTKDLVKKGDKYLEKNDLLNAFKCFQEVLKRGDKSVLLKCAKSSSSYDKKIEYLEEAMKEKIPSSFSKWRKVIMRLVYLTKDEKILLDFAKRFEKYKDYSDASIVYKKAKNVLNSQICYDKAKRNIDDITDGHQQYTFANFNMYHKDLELAKIMLQKAIENNISKAESKIKKLAQLREQKELSEVESLLEKGINYFEGKNGCQKNFNKAILLFEKASQLGCPKADFYIGSSIISSHGVDRLKKSAKSGDPDGQNRYAKYLKEGVLIAKNEQKAMHYYKLAADQGQEEASFEYGREKYEKGLTKEEKMEGIEYLKKSAEKLFPDAIYMYSKICSKTNPEDSKKFLEFAIEKGSQLALKEKESNKK